MYKLNYDYILLHLYRNTVDINIFVLLFCVGLVIVTIFLIFTTITVNNGLIL